MQFYTLLLTYLSGAASRLDRRDDEGATAVEYGLLVALIAAVIIAVVTTLGGKNSSIFSSVASAI